MRVSQTDTPSAAQVLARARELAGPAHRAAVDLLPAEIRQVAGYHAGWWDADGRASAVEGKTVRPALTLACAVAAGGTATMATAAILATTVVDAAVAVELVHDFSLLHDDVMDGDLTRRHRPTAWAVFGVPQTILAGDALLTAAIRQLAGTGQDPATAGVMLRVLSAAVGELCAGQARDLAFEARGDVTVAECTAMTGAKTGALLGAARELGALAAGADTQRARCYRVFGRRLGLAFQLADDLLGSGGTRR